MPCNPAETEIINRLQKD